MNKSNLKIRRKNLPSNPPTATSLAIYILLDKSHAHWLLWVICCIVVAALWLKYIYEVYTGKPIDISEFLQVENDYIAESKVSDQP